MKSMTGYGRGECIAKGTRIMVELNSVNRKQAEGVAECSVGVGVH